MYTVIIVDDEPLVRIGIHSCIPWEKHGFEVIGQADDGVKALELIEQFRPDIVITDIRMPNMDGLELISRLKDDFPNIKSIVLSCYNEFEYVRQALKLGAEDYVLKLSMEPAILIDVLQKTVQKIEENREKTDTYNSLNRELLKNQLLIHEDQIQKLLSGSVSAEQLLQIRPDLHSSSDSYILICCKINHYQHALLHSKLADQHLFKFVLLNILNENINEHFQGEAVSIAPDTNILLLCNPLNTKYPISQQTAEQLCNKISGILKLYLNITASFSISHIFISLNQIQTAYLQVQHSMQNSFYHADGGIFPYSDSVIFDDHVLTLSQQEEKQLLAYMELYDEIHALQIIDKFFVSMTTMPYCSPNAARTNIHSLVHLLLRYLQRIYNNSSMQIPNNMFRYLDESSSIDTLYDAKVLLTQMVKDIIQAALTLQGSTHRWEVTKIKVYIQQHIDENIDLQKASDICNISKSYFSTMFKKETGESFTDYLNRVKIEYAKDLIQLQGFKVYEAALAVGISDESYFSKLFKKYIGKSPSSVRLNE